MTKTEDVIPVKVKTCGDLKAWRMDLNITGTQASSLLGVSPRTYWNYEYGTHPIPLPIRLACSYIINYADNLSKAGIQRKFGIQKNTKNTKK